tara:strand:+ start:69 stop:629 length:561 start_codon:yes stop_codon:yes gene_type:complete
MEDIVTLVGPRSVGKSSIGKIMAKSLGWTYIDLDEYMNQILKKDGGIGGFTKKYGWDTYMKVLHKELKKLLSSLKSKKVVLDCGGGTISSEFPESELNAHLLRRHSKIVLILPNEDEEKGLQVLLEREKTRKHFFDWSHDKLKDKTRKDYFERVLGMRNFAHHIIHTNKQPPRKIAKLIEKLISNN